MTAFRFKNCLTYKNMVWIQKVNMLLEVSYIESRKLFVSDTQKSYAQETVSTLETAEDLMPDAAVFNK